MATKHRKGGGSRPGGRSARVRAAALAAAIDELAEAGYAALSLEGIARRAGVHKTTLYRRWGTRENLLLEAMLERGNERVPIPDTGSLRQDLFDYAKAIAVSVKSPEVEAVIRTVASESGRESTLADASQRFWRTRLEAADEPFQRAVERGELPPQADPGLLVEALIGPIYFRLLMTGEPLDDAFLRQIVDLVVVSAAG